MRSRRVRVLTIRDGIDLSGWKSRTKGRGEVFRFEKGDFDHPLLCKRWHVMKGTLEQWHNFSAVPGRILAHDTGPWFRSSDLMLISPNDGAAIGFVRREDDWALKSLMDPAPLLSFRGDVSPGSIPTKEIIRLIWDVWTRRKRDEAL